jgi:hypothetical protein
MRRDEISHNQGNGKSKDIDWHDYHTSVSKGDHLSIDTNKQTSLAILAQHVKLVKCDKGRKPLVSLVFSTSLRICTEYNNMSSRSAPQGQQS